MKVMPCKFYFMRYLLSPFIQTCIRFILHLQTATFPRNTLPHPISIEDASIFIYYMVCSIERVFVQAMIQKDDPFAQSISISISLGSGLLKNQEIVRDLICKLSFLRRRA